MRAALVLLVALCAATAAEAVVLEMHGRPIQGGLMRGQVALGCQVTLDGLEIPVAADGGFVVGFGRDQAPWAIVKAYCPGGPQARQFLNVAQREYAVQHIDGLAEDMVTFDDQALARIKADAAAVKAARATISDRSALPAALAWPLTGPITGVYGSQRVLNGEPRRPHFGVDVSAAVGTPVAAAGDGTVTLAADLYLSGWTVIVDHGLGLSSSYLHLSEAAVATGESVTTGQTIGRVGAGGRATGPHLDWRVNWLGARLDPELVAGPMP